MAVTNVKRHANPRFSKCYVSVRSIVNPLDSKGNYSATSNYTKLVHWPLMGGLLHWYSEEGHGRAAAPPSLLLAVPNVTAQPSTATVPVTVLLHVYDGPLLCGFNVAIKGLSCDRPRLATAWFSLRSFFAVCDWKWNKTVHSHWVANRLFTMQTRDTKRN